MSVATAVESRATLPGSLLRLADAPGRPWRPKKDSEADAARWHRMQPASGSEDLSAGWSVSNCARASGDGSEAIDAMRASSRKLPRL